MLGFQTQNQCECWEEREARGVSMEGLWELLPDPVARHSPLEK